MKQLFTLFLVALLIFSTGCVHREVSEGPRLQLSAITDLESTVCLPAENLNGNYGQDLYFHGVSDVTISLSGKDYPLATAIADGMITVEELMAYARIDAKNGFCEEIGDSYNGLSHFIYRYANICDLYFTHDIYETPDGQTHIMNHFAVYNCNGADNIYQINNSGLLNPNLENYPIDQEDWKLEFRIDDAASTGFTLKIRQTSSTMKQFQSQHIGQLYLSNFELFDLNSMESYHYSFTKEDCPIVQDSTSSFVVNFADSNEFPKELPSGSYKIYLVIEDVFDKDRVHPLMRDYHRTQGYWISFEIP